jgi:hypothetical protein
LVRDVLVDASSWTDGDDADCTSSLIDLVDDPKSADAVPRESLELPAQRISETRIVSQCIEGTPDGGLQVGMERANDLGRCRGDGEAV